MKIGLVIITSFLMLTKGFSQSKLSKADYEKAIIAYADKNYKAALKFFDYKGEYTPQQYILFSKCYDRLRDFPNENKTLSTGLARYKNSAVLYQARADFFQRMREYDLSIRDSGFAIANAGTDSLKNDCMGDRGWTKFLMNDLEGAVEDYELILENDPDNIRSINALGVVYDENGDYDMALIYLLKSYELDSSNQAIVSNLGFFYQKIKDYEKSLLFLDKAVGINPKRGYCYNNRGYTKLMLGDIKGALADVELSMKLYENNCYAYRNRALIYIEMGKIKKACKDLEMAIGLGFTTTYGDEVVNLQKKHCR